jgi:hypothetical protein
VTHPLAPVSLALLLVGAASGCSWLSMGPVPERPVAGPAGRAPDCKTSEAAPHADLAGGIVFGVPSALLLLTGVGIAASPGCPTDANGDGWCFDPRGLGYAFIGAAVVGLSIATLYGLSARHGYRHAARCAELRRPALDWLPTPSKLPKELPASCDGP